MPDLVTHTTFGYLVRNRRWDVHTLILFMMGTMLPDVFSRTFIIIFKEYRGFFHAWHTPIVIILLSALISILFEKGMRKQVFKYLLLGSAFHCLLDLFQLSVNDTAYLWFFPFSSTFDIQIGLFWAEDTLALTPLFILLFFISYKWERKIISFFRRKFGKNSTKADKS